MIEPPPKLPVDHLSVSSINLWLKCPLRWKRRYIDVEYEPSSASLVAGSAAHKAESTNYQQKIETAADLPADDVLDVYSDQFDYASESREVNWGDEKRGVVKDDGALTVRRYHRDIAPTIQPMRVERQFKLGFPHVDWGFTGYFDLETPRSVEDLKMRRSRMQAKDADRDLQPSAYLLARRAEKDPALLFVFHILVRVKEPYAELVPTRRSDRQLDIFVQRLYSIAAQMDWCYQRDHWPPAPPNSWWCSRKWCGYYDTCIYGAG
jgi:hypothetical protein